MTDRLAMTAQLTVLGPSNALRRFYRDLRAIGFERRDVTLLCAGVALASGEATVKLDGAS